VNTPIRVTHVIVGLQSGGAETMLYKLLGGMDRDAFHSSVVSLTEDHFYGEAIRRLGIDVHTLRVNKRSPFRLLELNRLLRREPPDIVQSWLYHSDLAATVLTRAGFRPRPRLVWNIRCSTVDFSQYSPITSLTVKASAQLSSIPDAVVVNSRAGLREHERQGYRPRRWEVIPNGFDLERYRPDDGASLRLRAAIGIPMTSPLIGIVARLDPMKGYPVFLEAARALLEKVPEVHFVLVGRGVSPEAPEIGRWLSDASTASHYHCFGERHDVAQILAGLDVYTLSSLGEGFPNVVGEAMACGVPCVVTDVGDAALIVGDTGIVVPPQDPPALAQAWSEILRLSPATRRERGAAARERIARHFTLQSAVKRYEHLYRELLETTA
jgi:glycosyltransferase involved in cell wall biosynthesis